MHALAHDETDWYNPLSRWVNQSSSGVVPDSEVKGDLIERLLLKDFPRNQLETAVEYCLDSSDKGSVHRICDEIESSVNKERQAHRVGNRRFISEKMASGWSSEPKKIYLFCVHGIGASAESIEENRRGLEYALSQIGERDVIVESVNWKLDVTNEQESLLERLFLVEGHNRVIRQKQWAAAAAADVLFYMRKKRRAKMIENTINQLNNIYQTRLPEIRQARIALIGHSLGSMIVYDILSNLPNNNLQLHVDVWFLWGSPLSAYKALTTKKKSPIVISVPQHTRYFNVINPLDPVAFRQEPLINRDEHSEPILIPSWCQDTKYFNINSRFDFILNNRLPWLSKALPGDLGSLLTTTSMIDAHSSYWKSQDLAAFTVSQLRSS